MTTLAYNSAFYKEHVGKDHLQRKFQSNQVFTPARIDRCTISEDKYASSIDIKLGIMLSFVLENVSLETFTVFSPSVELVLYWCTDDLELYTVENGINLITIVIFKI